MLYAPLRFGLDFLRNTDLAGFDIRHFGLTAAQWAMVALFFAGIWMLRNLQPLEPPSSDTDDASPTDAPTDAPTEVAEA